MLLCINTIQLFFIIKSFALIYITITYLDTIKCIVSDWLITTTVNKRCCI